MTGQVLTLGDVNIDMLLEVSEYPSEGGEAIATTQAESVGGSATNTARVLSGLGLVVSLIGCAGQDADGDRALSDLEASGVRTQFIRRVADAPTQRNITIIGPNGERTMFAYRGANSRLREQDIAPAMLHDAQLLHLSGYAFLAEPQRSAARRACIMARERGLPVTLDIPAGVVREIAPFILGLLPDLAMIFLSDADILVLTGSASASRLLDCGISRVAVKRGSQGSIVSEKGCTYDVDGFSVEIVDTTGAGDAFAAGHILGLLADIPLEVAGTLANALGALACTSVGSLHSLDSRRLEAILRSEASGKGVEAIGYIAEFRRNLSRMAGRPS